MGWFSSSNDNGNDNLSFKALGKAGELHDKADRQSDPREAWVLRQAAGSWEDVAGTDRDR